MMLEGQKCAYRSLSINNKTCYVFEQDDCLPGYTAKLVSITGPMVKIPEFSGSVYGAQQCVKNQPGIGIDKDTKPPSTWEKLHVAMWGSDGISIIGAVPKDTKGKKIYISKDIYPLGYDLPKCSELNNMYGYYTISDIDRNYIELEQNGFYNGTSFGSRGDGGCHGYAYIEKN